MERCASRSTQLGVDEAILDYLIYATIRALLADYKGLKRERNDSVKQIASSGILLKMVESFLTLFRSIHPNRRATVEIRFRLRLLRFTSMFTSRFLLAPVKPSLSDLQERQRQDREQKHGFDHNLYLPDNIKSEGTDGKEHVLKGDKNATSLYLCQGGISLLDSLPAFMAVSAAHSVPDRPITDLWMRLAAGFMAHAALEQCLVSDQPLQAAIKDAFSWGFDAESTAEEGSEHYQINAMFFGGEDEITGWNEIKHEHMQLLLPPHGTPTMAHARKLLAYSLPLDEFEKNIMDFVEGLLEAQQKPLYVQIEQGELDGLSQNASRSFRIRLGLA